MSSICILLTIVVHKHWELFQLDVSNVFLHRSIDTTIYMKQSPDFIDAQQSNHVCLLRKAIYYLKQTPRDWFLPFLII